MELKGKRILVTGGAGFLGRHVVEELYRNGAEKGKIIVPRSKNYDLRDREVVDYFMNDVDICVHLAAKVGGIGLNQEKPYDLFYDNIRMGVEIIDSAVHADNLEKLLVVGTICAYPKFASVPFKEDELWDGYPEETNAPYGIAKKSLLVQLQAARQQYGLNGIYLLPVNLYGPYDNFNENSSHVIPALIKKFYDAMGGKELEVVCWGTGKATREFLYVKDAAIGIVKALKHYNKPEPVNLGAGFEISIKELAEIIGNILGFRGVIRWDTDKPDGQPRRCLDTTIAKKEFYFESYTRFLEGLEETIRWYIQNGK